MATTTMTAKVKAPPKKALPKSFNDWPNEQGVCNSEEKKEKKKKEHGLEMVVC